MAEKKEKVEGTSKKSFFKTLKGEFSKISWPTKESVGKETIAVVLSTAVLTVLISLIDACIKIGVNFISGLGV